MPGQDCFVASGKSRLRGRLRPAGDKSLSHRALLFAALGRSEVCLQGLNPGADVGSTLGCLRALGIRAHETVDPAAGRSVALQGRGPRLRVPTDRLDCGNSGTTARLLAGVLAAQPFTATLDGDASLRRRPMGRLARPLRAMGARVEGPDNGETLPLVISGGRLHDADLVLPVASAQLKSALLLAAWLGEVGLRVCEPAASRDHTERWMRDRGGNLRRDPTGEGVCWQWTPSALDDPPPEVRIAGDPSAGAFYAAGAAILEGSTLALEEILLNPTRTAFYEVLAAAGARLRWSEGPTRLGEPTGEIHVEAGELRAFRIGGARIPSLLDEIPVLAVVAAFGDGPSRFDDVGELRVKESDRLAAIEELLAAFGVRTESGPDHLVVHPPVTRVPERVEPHVDHRISMAAAVLALGATTRLGGRCAVDLSAATISDPAFARRLEQLLERDALH